MITWCCAMRALHEGPLCQLKNKHFSSSPLEIKPQLGNIHITSLCSLSNTPSLLHCFLQCTCLLHIQHHCLSNCTISLSLSLSLSLLLSTFPLWSSSLYLSNHFLCFFITYSILNYLSYFFFFFFLLIQLSLSFLHPQELSFFLLCSFLYLSFEVNTKKKHSRHVQQKVKAVWGFKDY